MSSFPDSFTALAVTSLSGFKLITRLKRKLLSSRLLLYYFAALLISSFCLYFTPSSKICTSGVRMCPLKVIICVFSFIRDWINWGTDWGFFTFSFLCLIQQKGSTMTYSFKHTVCTSQIVVSVSTVLLKGNLITMNLKSTLMSPQHSNLVLLVIE